MWGAIGCSALCEKQLLAMPELAEVGEFFPNDACPDAGKTDGKNIVKYGTTSKGLQRYRCKGCGKRCKDAGVRPSMGSVGNYYKNTMCESFFSTPECELIERESYATRSEARLSVFDFIEGFITHTGCTRPSATSHR
jgi:hypothetical protein